MRTIKEREKSGKRNHSAAKKKKERRETGLRGIGGSSNKKKEKLRELLVLFSLGSRPVLGLSARGSLGRWGRDVDGLQEGNRLCTENIRQFVPTL